MKTPSLRSPADFSRVLADGTRRRAGSIQALALPQTRELPTRLGLAVRAPKAVTRNRARRRLRAVFAASAPAYGWDVVLQAGPAAASQDFQQLEGDVRSALREVTEA